eukprot:801846-Amphidinium_carterae.3
MESLHKVNGEEVVNNDGHHGMETRLASVELPAGDHCIVLLYIQALGTSGPSFVPISLSSSFLVSIPPIGTWVEEDCAPGAFPPV